MGMTSQEWEGLGILAIPAQLQTIHEDNYDVVGEDHVYGEAKGDDDDDDGDDDDDDDNKDDDDDDDSNGDDTGDKGDSYGVVLESYSQGLTLYHSSTMSIGWRRSVVVKKR